MDHFYGAFCPFKAVVSTVIACKAARVFGWQFFPAIVHLCGLKDA